MQGISKIGEVWTWPIGKFLLDLLAELIGGFNLSYWLSSDLAY